MRCRLSPTADVPSHTSGAAMRHERASRTAGKPSIVKARRGRCCGISAPLLAKLSDDTSGRMTAQKAILRSNDAGVLHVT